jgi:sugar-specific transcriptional regulator TrmB
VPQDGSAGEGQRCHRRRKFKAVNSRDNNFTQGKIQRRQKQIEESVARYMSQLDTADRQTAAGEEPSETVLLTKTRLKEKLAKLDEEAKRLAAIEKALLASPDKQISLSVLSYNLTRVLNIVGIKPLLAAMRA